MKLQLLGLSLAAVSLVQCGRTDVTPFLPTETYPEESTLSQILPKRAMVLVAHDDDMCGMAGTLSSLNKQGWDIRIMSVPTQTGDRDRAHKQACKPILDSVLFFGFTREDYRMDTASVLHRSIPQAAMDAAFNRALMSDAILEEVQPFNPSVLFTLDNEIGMYGHPEHVFISQLVMDLAEEGRLTPQFIYQNVPTESAWSAIMQRHSERMIEWGYPGDDWEKAKQDYGVQGCPTPSVQVHITAEATEKMAYLMSYNERERTVMEFFVPAFDEYSAEEYFQLFDREFFRVLSFDEPTEPQPEMGAH